MHVKLPPQRIRGWDCQSQQPSVYSFTRGDAVLRRRVSLLQNGLSTPSYPLALLSSGCASLSRCHDDAFGSRKEGGIEGAVEWRLLPNTPQRSVVLIPSFWSPLMETLNLEEFRMLQTFRPTGGGTRVRTHSCHRSLSLASAPTAAKCRSRIPPCEGVWYDSFLSLSLANYEKNYFLIMRGKH